MKPLSTILLCACILLPFVGCENDETENQTIFQPVNPSGRFGYTGGDKPRNHRGERRKVTTISHTEVTSHPPVIVDERPRIDPVAPPPELGPDPNPAGDPAGSALPPPTTAAVPFAKQVPGGSGYVFSPFAPGKKIEVIGYPPGTVVKCPYTQKEFKVP